MMKLSLLSSHLQSFISGRRCELLFQMSGVNQNTGSVCIECVQNTQTDQYLHKFSSVSHIAQDDCRITQIPHHYLHFQLKPRHTEFISFLSPKREQSVFKQLFQNADFYRFIIALFTKVVSIKQQNSGSYSNLLTLKPDYLLFVLCTGMKLFFCFS